MRMSALLCLLPVAFAVGAASAAREDAPVSVADVGALLAGRYDNAAQLKSSSTVDNPPPQHVTVTIEPTQLADWEI